jgi:Ca2+-transporting ATPase
MAHQGLSSEEVIKLRREFGENLMRAKEGTPWILILLSQLKSPLIYILIVVGAISLFFREYFDLVLIWGVIVLNTIMGFSQEYHAEKTLIALRKILKPKTWVIRDGKQKRIEAKELVPGDLVVLGPGDKVPADGTLVEAINLLVNEAILTGEEEAVGKKTEPKHNLLYMGTNVVAGRGFMKVSGIGQKTAIGQIEQSIVTIKEERTPMQRRLDELSKSLAKIVLVVSLLIFLAGLFYQKDVWEIFHFSIILAVAAIPEGLPIAITIILALGMRRILRRRGLVKRLISIETLGSTSVICTDKTGTLTEGIMKVVKVDFQDRSKALSALALNNDQKTNMEVTIWQYLKKEIDGQKIVESVSRVYEESFDSEKKYMMTVNKIDGREVACLTGAPEIVLSFCQNLAEQKNDILAKIEEWGNEGLKLLGVAQKEAGDLKEKNGFIWLGLLGIRDPLRPEAKEMIMVAHQAGIEVKIVTGDYRKTAETVARNLGFDFKDENIMEGQELERVSDEELKKRISKIVLFTRVTPHQKQKIVRVLQENGEIVAMTGDGVNDAPALKKANIGVAVGAATDVAKETADLILLDNNFKTIVAAVEEGRLIFSNIKKVVAYALSNSFVEIYLIMGSIFLGLPYPLTVVQILWLHLICDGPPDISLGFESKEKGLMQEKPHNIRKESILSNSAKTIILGISLIIGAFCLLLFWYFFKIRGDLGLARTVVFASVAAVDLIYIFSFRNLKKSLFRSENIFQNKFLFVGIIYGFLLTFAAVYVPALNRVLGTQPLPAVDWLLVLAVAVAAILWTEVVKYFSNFRNNHLKNNKI